MAPPAHRRRLSHGRRKASIAPHYADRCAERRRDAAQHPWRLPDRFGLFDWGGRNEFRRWELGLCPADAAERWGRALGRPVVLAQARRAGRALDRLRDDLQPERPDIHGALDWRRRNVHRPKAHGGSDQYPGTLAPGDDRHYAGHQHRPGRGRQYRRLLYRVALQRRHHFRSLFDRAARRRAHSLYPGQRRRTRITECQRGAQRLNRETDHHGGTVRGDRMVTPPRRPLELPGETWFTTEAPQARGFAAGPFVWHETGGVQLDVWFTPAASTGCSPRLTARARSAWPATGDSGRGDFSVTPATTTAASGSSQTSLPGGEARRVPGAALADSTGPPSRSRSRSSTPRESTTRRDHWKSKETRYDADHEFPPPGAPGAAPDAPALRRGLARHSRSRHRHWSDGPSHD